MRGLTSLTIATAIVATAACNHRKTDAGPLSQAPSVPLVNTAGQIIGEVRGGDSEKGAVLDINAHGLPPGVHGIHIHGIGMCDPPDFKSAGPHWNPTHKQHGTRNANGPHMGDLQNVTVGADGTLRAHVVVPGTYLSNTGRKAAPGAAQILDANGAALVIHAKPDDYKTEPSGNSGDRIACAVLGEPEAAATVSGGNRSASAAASSAATNIPVNAMEPNAITENIATTTANRSGR